MTDPWERWKASVRARMVPVGFSARVVLPEAVDPRAARLGPGRLWSTPAIRTATWLVAAVVLCSRLAAAFVPFLAT